MEAAGRKISALAIDDAFGARVQIPVASSIIKMPDDAAGYARRMYAALHEVDKEGVSIILIESPPETPEWYAIRDRLTRAAAIP
jgi:hypothetical protein